MLYKDFRQTIRPSDFMFNIHHQLAFSAVVPPIFAIDRMFWVAGGVFK